MIKQRVEKAKAITNWLETGTVNRKGAAFSLFTKSGKREKQYRTTITSSKAVDIPFGDSTIRTLVFNVDCKQITGGTCNCQGNSRNTVCYHGFFALVQKLKTAGMQIRFYENVIDAVNGKNFNGSLAKVQSTQGNGIVWATVHKIEVAETLEEKVNGIVKTQEERVNALRGTKEEQNGID